MFALNTELRCIEESESDVLEIYQSEPVTTTLTGSRPEKHTAYVCAVKKKSKAQVYVAVVSRIGQLAIYTGGAAEPLKNYGHSLQEGLEFARSLGFVPERVNLDYSPALREVMLQGFKIFTPPRAVVNAQRVKDAPYASPEAIPPAPALPAPAPPAAPAPTPSAAALSSAATVLSASGVTVASVAVAAATAAAESLTALADPSALRKAGKRSEQESAIAMVLAELRKELQTLGAEKDALSVRVQELSALQQSTTAELTSARTDNAKLGAERDRLAQVAVAQKAAAAELAALREEVALLSRQRDEAERRSNEHDEAARNRSEQQAATAKALVELGMSLKRVAEERDALAAQVQELSQIHLSATAALKSAKGEVAALTAEREKLARSALEVEQASATTAALQEEIALLSRQRDEAERRSSELVEEARNSSEQKALSDQAACELRKELEAVSEERDALSTQLQESAKLHQGTVDALESSKKQNVELNAERERLARSAQNGEGAASELAALREGMALLTRQRDEAKRRAGELAEENADLAKAVAIAQEVGLNTAAERDAALGRAARLAEETGEASTEASALREKLTALSAERKGVLGRIKKLEQDQASRNAEAEEMRLELSELRAERARLLQTNEQQTQRLQALGAELEKYTLRLQEAEAVKKGEDSSVPAGSGAVPQGYLSAAVAAGTQDRYAAYVDTTEPAHFPISMPPLAMAEFDFTAAGSDSFFSGCTDAAPVLFSLHPGQKAIEYLSPEDVVEVHRSTNVVAISPDGKGQERCEGYICRVKEGDGVRVYVAIQGKETGRTRVYLPETQPADDGAIAAAFAGAVSFAEQVGLMMEPLKFRSPEQRTEFITGCPVLRRAG